ncbi:hypothetical protein K440DRAFT_638957 [Wilcoxina mikolae CBS 423.85]|nr:hypothetical protein K440DRAFT_638957 [Wilcoxina mikolae CBS 423.85]
MSLRRHAKHSNRTGTRDKSRNTMHKYSTESHLSDPGSAYAHIRTIPAPDRTYNGERQPLPRGFSISANEGAAGRPIIPAPKPASSLDPNQVTFASKLREGIVPQPPPSISEPENRPVFGATADGMSVQKRPPAIPTDGARVPQGTTSPLALRSDSASPVEPHCVSRPQKVVFAPRSTSSLRHASGETVSSLMQQYGLQKVIDHPQNGNEEAISATQEELHDPVSTHNVRQGQDVDQEIQNQQAEERRSAIHSEFWAQVNMPVERERDIATIDGTQQRLQESQVHRAGYDPQHSESTSLRYVENVPQAFPHNPHNPHQQSDMAPPDLLQFAGGQLGERLPFAAGTTGALLMGIPPVDNSGRRGGISLPPVQTSERAVINAPPIGGASGQTGGGHSVTQPKQPILGYAYEDEPYDIKLHQLSHHNVLPEVSERHPPMAVAVGTNPYELQEGHDLKDADRQRIYNTTLRNSLVHRLETLQLCKINPHDFDANFNASAHQKAFLHHNLGERFKGLNDIGGSGPWGRHDLQDVIGSDLFMKSFDLDALRPSPPEGNTADPNAPKVSDDTGKTTVRCYDNIQKAKLVDQMKRYEEGKLPLPNGLYNPQLLPYRIRSLPEGFESEAVFATACTRLREYMKSRKSSKSLTSEDPPDYFERVPRCDLGLTVREIYTRGASLAMAPKAPARRDPAAENTSVARNRLNFVPAGYAVGFHPGDVPLQQAGPMQWAMDPNIRHEPRGVDIMDIVQTQLRRSIQRQGLPPPGPPPPPTNRPGSRLGLDFGDQTQFSGGVPKTMMKENAPVLGGFGADGEGV